MMPERLVFKTETHAEGYLPADTIDNASISCGVDLLSRSSTHNLDEA